MKIPRDLEADYIAFLEKFGEATSLIDSSYLSLPVATLDESALRVYRERVYTYELYHQLRLALKDEEHYTLNGELDKSGHQIMRGANLTGKIPDLLWHTPGDMSGNLVIIEVKPVTAGRKGIEKDLKTLTAFLSRGEYFRGVYLVYGGTEGNLNAFKTKVKEINGETEEIDLEGITLFWHGAAGNAATAELWA